MLCKNCRLAVDEAGGVGGVAVAVDGGVGDDAAEGGEVVGGEGDVEGVPVFLKAGDAFGAGDGEDVEALGEEPGEGDLRGGGAFFLGDVADGVDEAEVEVEGLGLEARGDAAPVLVAELSGGGDGAGEESASEG